MLLIEIRRFFWTDMHAVSVIKIYASYMARAVHRDQYHDRTYRRNFYSCFEGNWSKLRACLPSVLRRLRVQLYICVTLQPLKFLNAPGVITFCDRMMTRNYVRKSNHTSISSTRRNNCGFMRLDFFEEKKNIYNRQFALPFTQVSFTKSKPRRFAVKVQSVCAN